MSAEPPGTDRAHEASDPAPSLEATTAAETIASAEGDTEPTTFDRPLERGASVGRYVILERIGAGGMGVVYSAYDPELDRKVAIKLVVPRGGDRETSEGRARLLREAQAMAKLSHPNVITVHDVGTLGHRVFMAMEYVSGGTLGAYCTAERSVEEILRVYLEAARGLAAAHEAGLVHRDFKPDNAMLDARGRVRVMDFGLARKEAAAPMRSSVADFAVEHGGASPELLTQTGAVMGTPAYMSPEQHLGLPTGPPSDQYAFCVSLHEALYGVRPVQAKSRAAIALKVTQGEFDPPPAELPGGRQVPPGLRQVLMRGLSVDPGQRWPDLDALADALAGATTERGWRQLGLASTAMLALLAGGLWWSRTPEGGGCERADDALEAVWTPERAQDLEARFLEAARAPLGPETAQRVQTSIDTWSEGWAKARLENCEATQVAHTQSAELMDLRVACLDTRLGELSALLEVFDAADDTVVAKASEAVGALGSVASCDDGERLRARTPLPRDAATRAAIEAQRARLRLAKARLDAGLYEAARASSSEALAASESIDFAPLRLEALLAEGNVARTMADLDPSQATLREAFSLAVTLGDASAAARAALHLAHVIGYKRREAELGAVWAELAADYATAAEDPGLDVKVQRIRAAVTFTAGDYKAAVAQQLAAVEALEAVDPNPRPDLASALSTLGMMQHATAEYDAAEGALERALAMSETILGPHHPDTASVIQNLGLIAYARGEYETALERFERTLAIYGRVMRPDNLDMAQTRVNQANALSYLERNEAALEAFERAREAYVKGLGPRVSQVASILNSEAGIYKAQGKLELARDTYREALEIWREALGEGHPDTAYPLNNLGNVYNALGQQEEARAAYLEARDVLAAKNGAEHVTVSFPLTGLGYVAHAEENYREALDWYGKALAIKEKAAGPNAKTTASLRQSIAQAHEALGELEPCTDHARFAWETYAEREPHGMYAAAAAAVYARCAYATGDRKAALALADEALVDLAAAGDGASEDLAKLRAWRDRHPR